MKKFLIVLLSFIIGIVLFAGCGNLQTTDENKIPNAETTEKTYKVNVIYVYRDTIIDSLSDTKKEGEPYNYAKYKENIPDTYIEDADKESYFPDDYPEGTIGYKKGVLDVTYQIKPKYEQYMQITTTNANSNGRIIPFAVLGVNIGNNPYTVNDYNNEPVTFLLSDITEIKLFNTYSFSNNKLVNFGNGLTNFFGTIIQSNNTALKNLVKVDMTECTAIEDLPTNFFSGIPSLKTVVTNGCTKKLHEVGSNFLANSENLENFDFDFSALTNASNYFLLNTFINCKTEININLENLQRSGILFLYQRKNESNIPTINLYLGNTTWDNDWMVGDIYDTTYIGKYYPSVNINVYTNYKGNIETSLRKFIEAGLTVNIYDMPV